MARAARTLSISICLFVAAASAGASARADVLVATRGQPLVEVSHSVDLRVADGVATYTVRRVFSNPGTVADQVELEIDLPYGAAATGLRIRARDRWYPGELMEREAAEKLYREMTGFGPHAPKDPALLAWMWADKLSLQVFPVMPGSVSTVEYTLTAPTRYEGGRYHVCYPRAAALEPGADSGRGGLPLAPPVVTVTPAWGDALTPMSVDGRRATREAPIVLVPPLLPDWQKQLRTDPSASYVASSLEVPASSHTRKPVTEATVTLELAHTYRGDLEVELLTPAGARLPLIRRAGGGANDLRGSYTVALPPDTRAAGPWRLLVSDHAALDTGSLDEWTLTLGEGADRTSVRSTDTPLFVPDAPESAGEAGLAAVALAPPPIDLWNVRLGRALASEKRGFARLELDLAPELRPAPTRAQVVFLLDASHSLGPEAAAAQLDVVRAYASHVPDAELELVVYRRHAQRVFGRFVPVPELDAALENAAGAGAFSPGNGSALDEGLRMAAALLSDRSAPRRLVATSDELIRSSLPADQAAAALSGLPAEAVVHVVVPHADGDDVARLDRRDDAHLALLADHHHGIFADLYGLPARSAKALAPTVLELVRPTRIDRLAASAGFTLDRDTLREGDGVRLMVLREAPPEKVVLTGRVWSDPVRKEVVASAAFSAATAAFVFGADEHQGLSAAEQMRLALSGRAVSPVTSYVAAEPGVRPSTIGLDQATLGTRGFGSGGGGIGCGGAGLHRTPPDLRALVATEECVRSVRPAEAWKVALSVETTRDEVVDVATPNGSGAMASCLAEAVWALRLDARFDRERERFDFELSGPAAR
ncbi:MAG TPA: proprotein convertase P-domain-containing protein [Myxococcales bacterium]|jgi:subtilisin-like proprotein convertase family protein